MSESDVNANQEAGARLFAATIAAHGGDKFLEVKTVKLTGTGTFTTPPQTGKLNIPITSFTMQIAHGGRHRFEARGPGLLFKIVVRGYGKGGYFVLAGRSMELPADQLDRLDPLEFLRVTRREGFHVTAASEEITATANDGTPLLHYQIFPTEAQVTDIFVEWPSRRFRKLETTTSRGLKTVLVSNYQLVEGIPIFSDIQLLENGENIYKLKVKEITLNDPMENKLFE